MIVDHALNESEQKKAQKIYQGCEVLNFLSFNCCSPTILILLALSINIKDVWVSGIGPLTYFSYLFLPCGFYLAAKMGTGSSIRFTKIMEGFSCLLVMLAALLMNGTLQFLTFFAGVVLMYFFRSSGCAMVFPLQKNISNEKTLASMLVRNQMSSESAGVISSLLIAWLLKAYPPSLPYLLIGAFVILTLNGVCIAKIPEPAILKQMASQPLLKQVSEAFRNRLMQKFLIAGCTLNLVLAMLLPINILAVKIGFGLDDSDVFILSIIQLVIQVAASFLYKKLEKRIGPRNSMVLTYPLTWILALYWLLIPGKGAFGPSIFPFILAGLMAVFYSTAQANYFMIAIPNELQVGGTFLLFVITGGLMGAVGMLLNPLILSGIKYLFQTDGFQVYRLYFLITGLISIVGIICPLMLPVKYKEKRNSVNLS